MVLENLDCGCDLTRRAYLYVGKSITLRARIQNHVFGTSSAPPAPWLWDQVDRHGHNVYFEAWYAKKNLISEMEAHLIGLLQPKHNVHGKSDEFRPSVPFLLKPPFVYGNALNVRIGRTAAEMKTSSESWLKNTPGVYAFYTDHGGDLVTAHRAFGGSKLLSGPLPVWMTARIKLERRKRKLFRSLYPRHMEPIYIEEPDPAEAY